MSLSGTGNSTDSSDNGEDPLVPEGVLGGIEDIREENTASGEDIKSVLKF
ncbi:hypothetical protein [Halorubrum pallidum]|uniref:Uncharacterized protein n=1 Tax=Halorubrum pallidum TaxID=1526114 RepID=A0ABD5T2D5_9EURY